jgi:hypothetical protein
MKEWKKELIKIWEKRKRKLLKMIDERELLENIEKSGNIIMTKKQRNELKGEIKKLKQGIRNIKLDELDI